MNVKAPYGTVTIRIEDYEKLISIKTRMAIAQKKVVAEYLSDHDNYKPFLYCTELAILLGIELPGEEDKKE